MKYKEINLLPEKDRFNIENYLLTKKFIIISIVNFFILLLLTCNIFLKNYYYKSEIRKRKKIIKKLTMLNENFKPYKVKLSNLKKRLNILEKKKKIYFLDYSQQYSPFLSILILSKNFNSGVNINILNYFNGIFTIEGECKSTNDFYNFYSRLNRDENIKKVDFFYFKKDDNGKNLKFKLRIFLKKYNEKI